MNNIKDSTLPGDKPLSDEELMNLLIRVRRGELSPEEAERLLAGLAESEPAPGRGESVRQAQGHEASAPLNQGQKGTLIVDTFAANFRVGSARLGADLFRAYYDLSFPSVWVEGNTVTARFNYFSMGALREWLYQQQEGRYPRAQFSLNTAIPWEIELRSHMSNLNVNLRGVQLTALEGNGSMNSIKLSLDKPVGRVPLHYDAVASSLQVNCPACALRVEIRGNTNSADVLGRKFASKSAWQTPDFDPAQDGYIIVFTGEASSLRIIYE